MSPSNEPDDLHALAGEYVLGTLPMAEREAFEARLANDPELQKAVAAWEERFFPYTAMVDPVPPSDYLWPRIERSLKASSASASRPIPHRTPSP
jgi:anti-sigma-K factor RskA